jgi:hypothetical protein
MNYPAASGGVSDKTQMPIAASGGEPSARRICKTPTTDFFIRDQRRAFYGPIELIQSVRTLETVVLLGIAFAINFNTESDTDASLQLFKHQSYNFFKLQSASS